MSHTIIHKNAREIYITMQEYVLTREWKGRYEAFRQIRMPLFAQMLSLSEETLFRYLVLNDEQDSFLDGLILIDFLNQCFDDEPVNIVDHYLKRRGWKSTTDARAYLQCLRDTPWSIYKILDAVPGESLLVEDLIRETAPIYLHEYMGSKNLFPGEYLVTQVTSLHDTHFMTKASCRVAPHVASDMIATIQEDTPAEHLPFESVVDFSNPGHPINQILHQHKDLMIAAMVRSAFSMEDIHPSQEIPTQELHNV